MVMESLNLREIGTFMKEISLMVELKVKEKFTQHKTASLSKELSTKILNLPQVLWSLTIQMMTTSHTLSVLTTIPKTKRELLTKKEDSMKAISIATDLYLTA